MATIEDYLTLRALEEPKVGVEKRPEVINEEATHGLFIEDLIPLTASHASKSTQID